MQALEESIKFSQSKNWNNLELESDCVSLVNRFNKMNFDLTILGHHVQEIYRQFDSFLCFEFNWAPRCCNRIANHLCKLAKDKNCTMDFDVDYPSDIHELVLKDAIN